MTQMLGLGILAMVLADAVVGVRLLSLARRTRQLPELALGSALLLLGVAGYPLSIAARRGLGGEEWAGPLLVTALAAQNLACLCIHVTNWRVYRPASLPARCAVGAAALAFAASLLLPSDCDAGAWYYVGYAARLTAFVWAAAEAFAYHARLRRRLRLGLADPVVVDRFRLWAIATSTTCVGFLVFLYGRLGPTSVAESAPVLIATSLVGILAGTTIWLAFLPPEAYLRRVKTRATR